MTNGENTTKGLIFINGTHPPSYTSFCHTDPFRVEDLACNFVLWTGAGWAWPVKPLIIIVLFLVHGPVSDQCIVFLISLMAVIILRDFPPYLGLKK